MHDHLEVVAHFEVKLVLQYVHVHFLTAKNWLAGWNFSDLAMATQSGRTVLPQFSWKMLAMIWV